MHITLTVTLTLSLTLSLTLTLTLTLPLPLTPNQGYLFEGTAVRLVRYLQLTLRHHDAAGAGGGKQRGEGASVASQESQEAGPREGRGDNQRAGARRPRFIVLDLTQVPTLFLTPTVSCWT